MRQDVEDSPFAEPERRRFKKPRPRNLSPWEQQAETWSYPSYYYTCCGIQFGFMSKQALELGREVHQKMVHA